MVRPLVRFVTLLLCLCYAKFGLCQSGAHLLESGYPSGGTYLRGGNTHNDYAPGSYYGGASTGLGIGTAQATGAMSFEFGWNPTVPTDPAPLSAVVCTTASAQATGLSGVAADDGLGDAPVTTSSGGATTVTSSGTHYFVVAGSLTISRSVDPEASATGGIISGDPTFIGSAIVSVSVTIQPIFVSFAGAVGPHVDPSDPQAWESLPGQEVQASLTVPDAGSVSDFAWVGADPSFMENAFTGNLLTGLVNEWVALTSDDLSQNPLTFFGVGQVSDIDIGCTGSATFPDGSVQTVNGRGWLTVYEVGHDISAAPPSSPDNPSYPWFDSTAGRVHNDSAPPGASAIYFSLYVDSLPAWFSAEGSAQFAPIQLLNLTTSETVDGSETDQNTDGQYWLDNEIPYDGGGTSWQMAEGWAQEPVDRPGMSANWYSGQTVTLSYIASFHMHCGFSPPSNGIGGVVTSLAELPWSWDCSATFYPGTPGPVIPSPGSGAALSTKVENDWSNYQFYGVSYNSGGD